MTLPPKRPIPPVTDRQGSAPYRTPTRPKPSGGSPFAPAVQTLIAAERRRNRPEPPRETMTPFIVLKRWTGDNGARPAKWANPFAFRFAEAGKPIPQYPPIPVPNILYRFEIQVSNLGTAPVLFGMIELRGGGGNYWAGYRPFALLPFSCNAGATVSLAIEAMIPADIAASATHLAALAFDLLQDQVPKNADWLNDRHVDVIYVNKP